MSLLGIRGVAKRFGATVALDGVDLTLEPGEVRALIGENGAGKSTLMNILAGAVRADRGEMEIEGRLYAPNSPLDARRRGIALIHQELSLCPHLTVAENILLGIEPSRWGWIDGDADRRRALGLREHFGHRDLHPDRDVAAPPALKEASFELRRGEILGIAGLMGSGRTELVRALFGLEAGASGRIALLGRALAVQRATAAQRLNQGFGYLSEDRKREGLALPLSIADNLTATRLSAVSPGWGWLDLRRQWAAARRWMDALRIRAEDPVQPVRALSGGNQQKVAVGRLLNQDAEVLLLDEPTRGIDIGSKAQIYDTIVRSAAAGKAVLLVSSYLPELFGLCDRLAVMSRGRLSPARPIEEWAPHTVLATAIGESGP